jgi:hypothetical protein
MSTWNYRVLVRTDGKTGEKTFAIHEVYYDDAGKPDGCTENSVAPMGETLAELKRDMDHYRLALSKPVLEYESLEEVSEQPGTNAPRDI